MPEIRRGHRYIPRFDESLIPHRLQTLKQSRYQLGDRRMDVHAACDDGVGHVGEHDVEHRLDGLIALDAEDGGAQNFLCLRVDEDFHEAAGLAALAGAADMASGLFRMTIWNETIPTELRGRLAGIEQLSYMSGPLLGNARAGLMAERIGLMPSIAWGGLLCVGGMAVCRFALPQFWRFRKG